METLDPPDFLDEMIAEGSKEDPSFPRLVDAASRRLDLLQRLADERQAQGLSQTKVAAAMNTSQSALARLENEASDTKLSTIDRFADALGLEVRHELVKREQTEPDRSRRAA